MKYKQQFTNISGTGTSICSLQLKQLFGDTWNECGGLKPFLISLSWSPPNNLFVHLALFVDQDIRYVINYHLGEKVLRHKEDIIESNYIKFGS